MGKISDALDKIENLEDLGVTDSQDVREQFEDPSPPKDSINHHFEKLVNRAETSETKAERNQVSTPSKAQTEITVKKFDDPVEASGKWDNRVFEAVNNDLAIPEVFKTLRSKILHPLDGSPVPRTIMVTSAIPKEGKSFVTANLGVSLANGMDQHSLLVDCDLRQPTLARILGVNQKYGLTDYLRDQVDLSGLIAKSSVQKLSILPSGSVTNNPAELLSSARMHGFIEEISNRYEDRVIIFDSPPILMAAESIVLAGQVDAILLVVRQGRAKKAQLQKCIDTVDKNKILGIVFNGHAPNFLDEQVTVGYGYGYYSE